MLPSILNVDPTSDSKETNFQVECPTVHWHSFEINCQVKCHTVHCVTLQPPLFLLLIFNASQVNELEAPR